MCGWASWRPRAAPPSGSKSAKRAIPTSLRAPDGCPIPAALYIVRLNRVQNKLELLSIDVETGRSPRFSSASPTAYWINLSGDVRFLKDGKRLLWTSERDGFRHIYLYSIDGKDVKQLTKGDWEVTAIEGVDEAAGRVFYTSSEPSPPGAAPVQRQARWLRQARADQGGRHAQRRHGPHRRLLIWTPGPACNRLPRTVLRSGDGAELGVYREADRAQSEEFEILPTEIVSYKTPDGQQLYARLIKPAGFQAGRKYPVVVTVYGGPGVALPIRNSWQGVSMDQVYAQRGYVVWESENRGGLGRGHAFETSIYHKLGVQELADQVAGVKYLISLGFVDPERIGIHGWSYGGFMTANALLNAPDVFRCGVAGAPVTDWLNYDTIYTERYMGLPKDNPDGYRSTALAPKAANLKGRLMIMHNFEDDNVLFQNTLQLTDALQRAGKIFDFMLYPQKSHGVTGAAARQMRRHHAGVLRPVAEVAGGTDDRFLSSVTEDVVTWRSLTDHERRWSVPLRGLWGGRFRLPTGSYGPSAPLRPLDPEQAEVLLGQARARHLAVHEDVAGVAGGQGPAAFRQAHFIGEGHHARVGLLHPSLDHHLVVETRRRAVPAGGFGHRQEHAVLVFHVAIVEAQRLAQLHAPHLHPDQVVRVVDHAHAVGFGVTHAEPGFVRGGHGENAL